MMVISKAGVATTTNCVTSVSRAMSVKFCGCGNAKPMKNRIKRISTPQNTAPATVGVSSRSCINCRNQRRTSSRSLSRNSTVSELNCSTAQRIANRQHASVAMITGGPYDERLEIIPLQHRAQQQHHAGHGNQAVAQIQFHARRHWQHHQRQGHQHQRHQVVLPLLGAAGKASQAPCTAR